jgi:hypothetical protein
MNVGGLGTAKRKAANRAEHRLAKRQTPPRADAARAQTLRDLAARMSARTRAFIEAKEQNDE